MLTLLFILGAVAVFIPIIIWRGFVLSTMWGWFIVPTFGTPALSVVTAIGVTLVISFLTYHHTASKKKEQSVSEQLWDSFGVAFIYPLLSLGVGWVVLQFM